MSAPLTLLGSGAGQANICPAGQADGQTDGRIRDDRQRHEEKWPSQEWGLRGGGTTVEEEEEEEARGPVSDD